MATVLAPVQPSGHQPHAAARTLSVLIAEGSGSEHPVVADVVDRAPVSDERRGGEAEIVGPFVADEDPHALDVFVDAVREHDHLARRQLGRVGPESHEILVQLFLPGVFGASLAADRLVRMPVRRGVGAHHYRGLVHLVLAAPDLQRHGNPVIVIEPYARGHAVGRAASVERPGDDLTVAVRTALLALPRPAAVERPDKDSAGAAKRR